MIRRFTVAVSALAVVWGMAAPAQAQSGSIEVYGQVLPTPFTIGVSAIYATPLAENLNARANLNVGLPIGGNAFADLQAQVTYLIPLISDNGLVINAAIAAEGFVGLLPTQSAFLSIKPGILAAYNLDANTSFYGAAYWNLIGFGTIGVVGPDLGRRGFYAGAIFNTGGLRLEPFVGFYFPDGIGLTAKVTASYAISSAFTVGATLGLDGNISYGTLGPVLRIFGRYSF